MFSRRWYVAPVIAILLIGLLVAGGYVIHRAGWTQGYSMGLVAEGGEEAAPYAFGPRSYGYRGRFVGHSPLLSGFGLVIGIMVLVVVAKCIAHLLFWRNARRFNWASTGAGKPPFEGAPGRMPMYGPAARMWARRWHRMHRGMPHQWWGHVPPWFCEEGDEPEEDKGQAAEDAPEVETES